MKYCVLITDGAAGWPLGDKGGKTCLELANTPNLDALASEATLGMAKTVPNGMEPSSACACLSVLGYDPRKYYKGRASIEAVSMGVSVAEDEAVFRCNLVTIAEGKMESYCGGQITTDEASRVIDSLNEELGGDGITFYKGVAYRHLLKVKGSLDNLAAKCTPPHDISGKEIADYLPKGEGSVLLNKLIQASEKVLKNHPVNKERIKRGELPVTSIWLFWGSGQIPEVPPFEELRGVKGALTSGVDLLKGLGKMMQMDILEIDGVTDSDDNNYKAQAEGAIKALDKYGFVAIHVEAPDEMGHMGDTSAKIKAIENIDRDMVSLLRNYKKDDIKLLIMPDHPTPIKIKTHTDEAVPFLLWGKGIIPNGAKRFTEKEASKTGFYIDNGFDIMDRLI